MIVVRSETKCQPGRVNELVERFRSIADQLNSQDVIKRARVMTDLTGPFDTVVVESEVESIDAYYELMRAMFADQDAADAQSIADLMQSGFRTLYTLEASFERS